MGNTSICIIAADVLPIYHHRPSYKDEPLIFTGSIDEVCPRICSILRQQNSDMKIVYLHWGEEFIPYPDKIQRYWARKLIEAGADAVVGSHPHIPQGIEWHLQKIIAYSLGNFISDMQYDGCLKGYMLRLSQTNGNIKAEVEPYEIDGTFRPVPSPLDTEYQLFPQLDNYSYSDDSSPPLMDKEYRRAAIKAENEMWRWTKKFYRKNFLKYPLSAHIGWLKEKLRE